MSNNDKKHNKTSETPGGFVNHPAAEEKPDVRVPGPKGIVGTASPSTKLKRLWHESQFSRVDANKANSLKKLWKPNRNAMSLREFVQTLLKDETHGATASRWVASKLGEFNQERSDDSKKRIALQKSATKLAKKSKGKAAKAKPVGLP